MAMIMMLCVSTTMVRAQDQASSEKTFKAICAGCHGADATGQTKFRSNLHVTQTRQPEKSERG